ncbi:ISLre2 family transposase [Streptococcus cameli]
MCNRFQLNVQEQFQKFVREYEDYVAPILRARGYKRKDSYERTVLFTFGEMTFTRSRWYRNGKQLIPLDEKLGLIPYERYSKELLYQVTRLGGFLPYRKVVEVVKMMYGIEITKDTVLKALKLSTLLFDMKKEVTAWAEPLEQKTVADIIYIEGDGVMVKTTDTSVERYNMDLSHFVVHTGRKKVGQNRYELQNKKEFIATNYREAVDAVLDYLYQNFAINRSTTLVTNSDCGKGYGYKIFEDIAKALKIRHHEHFWDSYHVNQAIKDLTRPYPSEIREYFFKGLREHKWSIVNVAFDTLESLEENEQKLTTIMDFKRKLRNRWKHTLASDKRGLPAGSIGIMESQHRKITYRMKHQGMYWSVRGADTMSQVIIAESEGELRDLFFGDWQKTYQKNVFQGMTAGEVQKLEPEHQVHSLDDKYKIILKRRRHPFK